MEDAVTCPWGAFTPTGMKFCEESLCAWVTQPANTWSNVGFLVVAAWIATDTRRDDARRLRWFWTMPAVIGVGSAFYHASGTLLGQAFDLFGMFLFSAFVVIVNARRSAVLSPRVAPVTFVALVAVSMALMFLDRAAGIVVFTLQITVAGVLELRLYRRRVGRPRYGPLMIMSAVFMAAFALWIADITGAVCDPDNHIFGGHAAWHLGCALSLRFAYLFYRDAGAPLPPAGPSAAS
jgi:hypothetical protein